MKKLGRTRFALNWNLNMEFDSLFDEAMKCADFAIEGAMASEFRLLLRNGSSLDIKAIFDSKLMPEESSNTRVAFIAEHGVLTVFNMRIEKQLVSGASVDTPLGTRHVSDVLYPDETTSLLILSMKPNGQRVSPNDNFL
ncbi:hypothetical protein [Vibrio campbellii]|uniref:Uncharacterized protein n=2 Tax=Vibrio campbellii TaxID=680 RepID=A7MW98_VIBC1|nr:hypothetical protein [Vibrio campbellii]ABU70950.1 hypothetical protein VIBHAR_01985 [Vibrio campbellii ATCC BAA-1116]MBT0203761.1 hypothetical protein [Vibrio campbellii]|tara:strand:- start:17 stop:433 length:417 start_codon:yes stop_codon:yes gene_type:complete